MPACRNRSRAQPVCPAFLAGNDDLPHHLNKGNIMQAIKNFIRNEDGVTAIEYALIAALIAAALVIGVQALGGSIRTAFTSIGTNLTSPPVAP